MTKREMYTAIMNIEAVSANEEMRAFIEHEIELLNRKSSASKKPTKTQIENEGFKTDIIAALTTADTMLTIKELCEICPSIQELSNQRVTHLLTALRKDEKVERTYIKKVPYFSIKG